MEGLTYFQEDLSTSKKQLERLIEKREEFMLKVEQDYEKIVDPLEKQFDKYDNASLPDEMLKVNNRIQWNTLLKRAYMKKAEIDIDLYTRLKELYYDAPAAKKQRVRELHNEGLRY